MTGSGWNKIMRDQRRLGTEKLRTPDPVNNVINKMTNMTAYCILNLILHAPWM